MTSGDDDLGDAFTHDWGATPESRRDDAIQARFSQAIERDDADALRRAAAENPEWARGDMLILDAARYGSARCVAALIELGADIHTADEGGATPLIYAAQGDLA